MLALTQSTTFLIGPIAKLLGLIMEGIYRFLDMLNYPDIGLCIMIFTVVVYLCMFPLTLKTQKFSKMSQIMNPEIKAIQDKYKDKKDLLDSLFFDVISVMHPSIYSLKRNSLWERAKNAYLNYDDATLMLLRNLKINKRKDLNITDLKNDIFLLQNEIICMKRRYPYYLENNLSSVEWIESYNKEINTRIKKLQVKEKEIFEKLV